MTNAVVTWNTVYMAAVIDRLRAEGKTVNEEDIARLSPARYEHINPYGKYRFEIEEGLSCSRLRPPRRFSFHAQLGQRARRWGVLLKFDDGTIIEEPDPWEL